MALQGYGTELGITALVLIMIKEVVAPLIKRIPIFGNNKAKTTEGKLEKLRDEVHNPEMIPGKSDTCQEHDRTITKIGTCLDENVKRLDRMEGKIDTAITLIRNGGKD